MEVIFARHGESEANVLAVISNRMLPHHLTARGREQAAAMTRQLVGRQVSALYCSPILRARETAEIVGQAFGIAPVVSDALREWDCGEFEGRGDEAAWQAHHAATLAWAAGNTAYCLPGGESFDAMRARFLPFVHSLIAQPGPGSAMLISHGSVLQHMLPDILANVDHHWTSQHSLPPATFVCANLVGTQLVCTNWAGAAYPGAGSER